MRRSICGWSGWLLWTGALAVVLLAGMGIWSFSLRGRVKAAALQVPTMENRLHTVSTQLQEAQDAEPMLRGILKEPQIILAERETPRWATVLRRVVLACSPEIELQNVHAQENPKTLGACELRIGGVAFGQAPRVTADRFRQTLMLNLEQLATRGSAKAEFERLEDGAESPPGAQKKALFTIVATAQVRAIPAAGDSR